jgi:predicted short-subunit dehydrogenase-like oxidoreductase (DUF2520 family)
VVNLNATDRLRPEERRSLRVGVAGAGRLGTALASALAEAGYRVEAVASRRAASTRALAASLPFAEVCSLDELPSRADLVFLAVPDGAIEELAAALSWRRGQAVVHTSGAQGLDVLGGVAKRGAVAGCLHPLQAFPAGLADPAERFRGITCGVEAAEPLGSLLEAIVADLGARSVRLEGVDRARYHAAAVLASNDVVALAAAAGRAWELAGLPPGASREALWPLIHGAVGAIGDLPLERALTGPVARGDVETVRGHIEALRDDPELLTLYRALGAELLRLDLGHSDAVVAQLRGLLEGA